MRDSEFTRLYNAHASSLYAFLSYRAGDPVLAEDLLADTFERVLRTRNGFDRRRGSERTWLYTIALNCVRDHGRRAAAEVRALARVGPGENSDPRLEAELSDIELKDAVHEALEELTEDEREAVALRFGADLPLAEVAAILNEPRSRVESRIYRGLKKLRVCLTSP